MARFNGGLNYNIAVWLIVQRGSSGSSVMMYQTNRSQFLEATDVLLALWDRHAVLSSLALIRNLCIRRIGTAAFPDYCSLLEITRIQ